MSRILTLALAGTTALGLSAASLTGAEAAPFPALNSAQVGGTNAVTENVRYRGGYYGGRGYYGGYGYRRSAAGAAFAGAALGLIGGAIAASAAPRYGYYDNGYYGAGYGYPAYGGGYGYRPVYGGGYGYGYGYRPVYGGYGGYDYGYGW